MKTLLLILTGLALSLNAQAKLGESLDQLDTRYGTHLSAKPIEPEGSRVEFVHDGYKIHATLVKNQCVEEAIEPVKEKTLSNEECVAFAAAITGTPVTGWASYKKASYLDFWRNKGFLMIISDFGNGQTLFITTQDYQNRTQKAAHEKEAAKINSSFGSPQK